MFDFNDHKEIKIAIRQLKETDNNEDILTISDFYTYENYDDKKILF